MNQGVVTYLQLLCESATGVLVADQLLFCDQDFCSDLL